MNYLIALGSNLGDRKENLQQAIRLVAARCGEVLAISSLYETPPQGFEAESNFFNQVIHLKSDLSPIELLNIVLKIELDMGRVRQTSGGYASRIIDLDIIMADELILNSEQLRIPHPRMAERRFVLEPAAEIAADWKHPELKMTVSKMLAVCVDDSKVSRI